MPKEERKDSKEGEESSDELDIEDFIKNSEGSKDKKPKEENKNEESSKEEDKYESPEEDEKDKDDKNQDKRFDLSDEYEDDRPIGPRQIHLKVRGQSLSKSLASFKKGLLRQNYDK